MTMGPIKYLTIHCTATPEGKAFTAQQINAMDIARADLGHVHEAAAREIVADALVQATMTIARVGNG